MEIKKNRYLRSSYEKVDSNRIKYSWENLNSHKHHKMMMEF